MRRKSKIVVIEGNRLTPRQTVAIRRPVLDRAREVHPRHSRFVKPFNSILTFDLHKPDVGDQLPVGVQLVDGWVGMWHARIAKIPRTPVAQWEPGEEKRATQMVKRLVAGVGRDEPSIREDPDEGIYMAFRWGTLPEVRRALDQLAKPGKLETD